MSERECSEILVYGNIKTAIFPEAGALNDATHEQWLAPTCPAFPFRPRRALAPGDDAALACVCWGWGRGDRPVVGVRRREAIIGDRPPRRTSSSATRGSWPAREAATATAARTRSVSAAAAACRAGRPAPPGTWRGWLLVPGCWSDGYGAMARHGGVSVIVCSVGSR